MDPKDPTLLVNILHRPERRGGYILWGKWTCPYCAVLFIHNEDCACTTPGCECNQCDYRGANDDGE
jgi:hypothetical protein